ncbi:MAG: branched-chain amino acid ABC transporter permease [Deltaproteobacteria bacterium]|nr:branched-chain amino acid ABC transporter permease [Deltaproteobacteria bacterium]
MLQEAVKRHLIWIAIFLILLILPFFIGTYLQHIMIFIFFYAYLSQCWNILSGYTGQFSLGNAAFFGLGAYTSSVLFYYFNLSPWIGMFIGAFVALAIGLFIGYVSFHFGLKEAFFALATLAFAEILRIMFLNMPVMGGAQGILIPLKGDAPLLFQFDGKIPFYYISFIMMVSSTIIVYIIERSKIGYYFKAIHQNEESAEALGVNARKYKIYATGISAFLTAFGGTFYAQYFMYIDPNLTFGPSVSFDIMLRSIIGGVGTLAGPIIGSFILTPLGEITREIFGATSGIHMMAYGAILILVCLFMPRGVYPWFRQRFSKSS